MIKLIKYILIMAIVLGVVLYLTPLNLYYSQIEKNIKPLKLNQISGSIIKGESQQTSYLGLNIGKLSWLNLPNSWKSIGSSLKIESKDYDIAANITPQPNKLLIDNLMGTIDWGYINNQFNLTQATIEGYIDVHLDNIVIFEKRPRVIEGRITTKEFRLVSPIQRDLGDIYIEFEPLENNVIVGTVNSNSNVINVSGGLYIYQNHRWELKLNVIPKPGEYEIDYALRNIGSQRAGGGRSINYAGFY